MSTRMNKLLWPSSLSHLAYTHPLTEMVVIGEQSGKSDAGYNGDKTLYAVLVPLSEVKSFVSRKGGICAKLDSGCDGNCDFLGHYGNGLFYIEGPDAVRYESLVCSWKGDENHVVFEPSPAILKHFGLIPRYMSDQSIAWDDLSRPLRNVITVSPCAQYKGRVWLKSAKVEIRRDYLHEFLYQNECAAAAVFEEQRFSSDDRAFSSLVGKRGWTIQERPGVHLQLGSVEAAYFDGCSQRAEAWGCKLIMIPTAPVLSDDFQPELNWPKVGVISCPDDATKEIGTMGEVFVSDSVLGLYEGRPEFSVDPESGSVSYGGQWCIGDCRRVGRNHIAVVLRKLYEGTPSDVIRQFHKCAVDESVAWEDERQNGKRNIGNRARDLAIAYLNLLDCVSELSFEVGVPYSARDIGGFDRQIVEYEGLWQVEDFVALGRVAPMNMDQSTFLLRCLDLHKLLERLSIPRLRTLLNRMGLPKKQLEKLSQIKLMATICQFAALSQEWEMSLSRDVRKLKKVWDDKSRVAVIDPVFALNVLRNKAGHKLGIKDIDDQLGMLGIDPQSTVTGWGKALDHVYETLIGSLNGVTALIRDSM